MSIWDNRRLLDKLEEQRDSLRKSGKRMTFDCMNTRCFGEEKVFCRKGKSLGQADDGSVTLIGALRGICSGVCKTCEDFETEERG